MPYTVTVSFDKFREAIELSGSHREIANSRKDRIVSLLSNDFEILDAFPSGSIPRYTALSGYADLDIIVVLHYTKHIKDKLPSAVLYDVKKSLDDQNFNVNVRRNGQAVTLHYKTWPNVDIVPVSRTSNYDGSVNCYNVPNTHNEDWLKSRPRKHSSDMTDRNALVGEKFKRIVKMIKWWNHQHSNYLQSYHIEVLALKILTTTIVDYSWDVYRFFDEAVNLVSSSLWHEYDYVDRYLTDSNRTAAVNRLTTAKNTALTAWHSTYGENDDHEEAIRLWGQIFGDKFPNYG